jgi:ABC-type cobalamin/Fe3+-siderophores transport system ATPase subunit
VVRLDEISIEKFKRIDAITLPLSDLNILVGANGSGKSSVLQALHLASCLMRQADRIRTGSTAMVRVSDLDYLPTDEYWRLGHGADWGNKSVSPSSKVFFKFRDSNNIQATAQLEIRSARNAGISVQGELPEIVRTQFRGEATFFSGFIPGISGIPNVEQKKSRRVVLKACSFGDSNVYLRNALNLISSNELIQIEEWLKPLIGSIKLNVKFNETKDFEIHAEADIDNRSNPLELLGTGYLQLIQIFCYVLLFKPKILLIDEPDIHLHPTVQEKLAQSLLRIARAKDIKIIMTTHSPFIVRGAPADTNVFWLSDGKKKDDSRALVELALGWGAFGKKVIVVSEDAQTELLKKLIQQWPEIDQTVTVLPGRGYKHIPNKHEISELRSTLGNKFNVLVHRDRDSLTDDEVSALKRSYKSEGIELWITEQSDIEAEFCDPEFLSILTQNPIEICKTWLSDILMQKKIDILFQFNKQRISHNQELYKNGGSPTNESVWSEISLQSLAGAKGKFIFNQLKNKIPNNKFSETTVQALENFPERAKSLKAALEVLLR